MRSGCLGVVSEARDDTAGGQGARQQGRIIEFARDRQGAFGLVRTAAAIYVQRCGVGQCADTDRGRHLDVFRISFGQNGIEPCPAFQKASPSHP